MQLFESVRKYFLGNTFFRRKFSTAKWGMDKIMSYVNLQGQNKRLK